MRDLLVAIFAWMAEQEKARFRERITIAKDRLVGGAAPPP